MMIYGLPSLRLNNSFNLVVPRRVELLFREWKSLVLTDRRRDQRDLSFRSFAFWNRFQVICRLPFSFAMQRYGFSLNRQNKSRKIFQKNVFLVIFSRISVVFPNFSPQKWSFMQEKTQGVVLRTLKYNDNSLIVDIYTATRGTVSFMVKLPKSRNCLLYTSPSPRD